MKKLLTINHKIINCYKDLINFLLERFHQELNEIKININNPLFAW